MRIAILSDIHDRLDRLEAALKRAAPADALLCLGDLCSPFVVDALGQGFAGPTHVVFGNNDGDLFRITTKAAAYPQLTLHGEFAELELGGKRIALTHFPEIGRPLVRSGLYDVVCFGHNHTLETERVGDTWSINPGEVAGVLKGKATFAVYDTVASAVEVVHLD